MLLGALEAGGTKMVMGLLDEQGRIIKKETCSTRQPEETMPDILSFFSRHKPDALGIATFGPVDLDPSSPTFGSITNTPKLSWRGYPLLRRLQDSLKIPCAIDTDVNGAVLAEATLGAALGLDSALYLTVGTGIGGGLLSQGQLVHGLIHPEWGHVLVIRHPDDPLNRGICPYHASCAEGFASGAAMQSRWDMPAQALPDDHPGWEMEAWYLAQVCHNALMTVSPRRIMLGGGVMHRSLLYPMIRKQLHALLGGYLSSPALSDMESFLTAPALYPDSGLIGAGFLAKQVLTPS